jgi:hypothetical protein
MWSDYISLPVFLISLAVGLFYVYIMGPEMKRIYVYPTPENVGKVQYVDKANNCFAFESKLVKCPTNGAAIESIPIQS